eukprot:Gb_11508 [translate_table: standard]
MKSLIRVGKYGCFMMNGHLQDLGRQIVAEESPESLGTCSSLWHPHDVNLVIRQRELELECNCCIVKFFIHRYELVDLPTLPGGLNHLNITESLKLKRIPNITHLSEELVEFPPFPKFLSSIYFPQFTVKENPNYVFGILSIVQLEWMQESCGNSDSSTKDSKRLTELRELEPLEDLGEISLYCCDKLVELSTLYQELVKAAISFCSQLKSIYNMSCRIKLKVLSLFYCETVESLEALTEISIVTDVWNFQLFQMDSSRQTLAAVHKRKESPLFLNRNQIIAMWRTCRIANFSARTGKGRHKQLFAVEEILHHVAHEKIRGFGPT